MPLLKSLYIGEIKIQKETVCLTHKGTRHACISDLNSWLFDFTHNAGRQILQLPPLDDWSISEDDSSLWFYIFPDIGTTVSVRMELVDYP